MKVASGFCRALYERRTLSAVADRRYSMPLQHAFDGTEPVPPIILVSAVTGRWRRKFVL